ncbi:MAG: hypothetical protein AAB359_08510, partial [Elusimicrobiota bacterium]
FAEITRGLFTDIKTFRGRITTFGYACASAKRKAEEAETAAIDFISAVDRELGSPKIMLKAGVEDVATPEIKSKKSRLEDAKALIEWEKKKMAIERGYADFLLKAARFYSAQAAVVDTAILKLRAKGGEIRQVADEVNGVVAGIKKEDAAKAGNFEILKAAFTRLWDEDRDSAINSTMKLRGFVKIKDWKFDDDVALRQETEVWAAASPRLASEKGNNTFTGDEQVPVADNMVAVTKRAKFGLPGDIEILSVEPAEIIKDAQDVISAIAKLRLEPGINLPAGGAAPGGHPPAPVPVSPELESARNGALQAYEAVSGNMERLKIAAKKDANSLSAIKGDQRAQDAVISYNEQMVSIDKEMAALKGKIAGAKDEALIKEYRIQLEGLRKDAASTAGALAKEYTDITRKPSSADSGLKLYNSAAAGRARTNAVTNPKPDTKPGHKAATPGVIETIFLAQRGEAYGLAYQSGVEQLVLKGGKKNSGGTNAYYSGKASRGAHVFNVNVTCSYKAESNTWEIAGITLRVESGPATQSAGVSGGVSMFGLSAGGNATKGVMTLQNGIPASYPGFAGKPCK